MGISLLTKLRLSFLLMKKEKIVKKQKKFLKLPIEEQMSVFMKHLSKTIKETKFVKRYFPQLLKIKDPEEILDLQINWDYPEPRWFDHFRKKILIEASTSGTTSAPKKIFYPNTYHSVRLFIESIFLANSLTFLNNERIFFRKTFIIYEPGLASDRFSKFLKFTSKEVIRVNRHSLKKKDLPKVLESAIKQDIELLIIEMPLLIDVLDILKELNNKNIRPREPLIIFGGGDILAPAIKRASELYEAGFPLKFIDLYGATEAVFMGGSVIIGDEDHPYYSKEERIYPVPYSTLIAVGKNNRLYFPHKVPDTSAIYDTFITQATAFCIPNYYIGDTVVVRELQRGGFMVIGRKLASTGVKDPSSGKLIFAGKVIRASGIVIKEPLVGAIATALGLDEDKVFLLIDVRTDGKVVVNILYPDPDLKIAIDQEKLDRIKNAISGTSVTYFLKDIEDGYVEFSFKSGPEIQDLIERLLEETKGKYKLFTTRTI